MTRLRRTADVVVIGGGIMGASIAYHLASKGCTRVFVLEAAEMFGLGSTGLNAGGVRHQFSTRVNIELSKLSIEMMEQFADDMGQEVGLRRCGYLFLLDNAKDLERFRCDVDLQNSLGVPSRMVHLNDVALVAPEVALHGIVGGAWCDRDGLVDPHSLVQGYVSGARRLGVTLLTGARVTAMEKVGRGFRVTCAGGSIDAGNVVIAAGPWSADVGKLAGVELPIQPIRRQIVVTNPVAGLRADFPFVIDFTRALYFHREGAGILTGMSNRDERPSFDTSVDEGWRERHLEQAIDRLPLLADAALAAEWAGLYEVTPDDQPIVGRLSERDGLFACAGFSGHGLMHGPAAGLLVAEEIVDGGAHTIDINALRWSRFTDGKAAREYSVV